MTYWYINHSFILFMLQVNGANDLINNIIKFKWPKCFVNGSHSIATRINKYVYVKGRGL